MKRNTIFATLLLLLLAPTTFAQTHVTQRKPGSYDDGITYYLPRTRLQIVITADRTTHHAGELAPYAQQYLRISDAAQTDYDEWQIMSIALIPYGVADSTRAYTVRFNQRSSASFLKLAPDGCLLAINGEAADVPQLATPSVTPVQGAPADRGGYKTQEMLAAGSTEKMAELAAEEIYDIRENRSLLSKGQADFMPADGEQMKLMLATLDRQEKGLLRLFTGYETKERHVLTLDYEPDPSRGQRDVAFRFSRWNGLVDRDDLSGEPYFFDLQFAAPPAPQSAQTSETLRYMAPGNVTLALTSRAGTHLGATIPMAQYGRVENLGGDLFNNQFRTHVTVSPINGGILKIEVAK
ncbi:MAG: DUF4831 family protein [Bacteroidaceae bacterium]|nr:DUF4831 family protein [Bacteroidaceae bacterium]